MKIVHQLVMLEKMINSVDDSDWHLQPVRFSQHVSQMVYLHSFETIHSAQMFHTHCQYPYQLLYETQQNLIQSSFQHHLHRSQHINVSIPQCTSGDYHLEEQPPSAAVGT